MSNPLKVFLSYSHEDKREAETLKKHLSVLINEKVIELWCDRNIGPGQVWNAQIEDRLHKADIILLLVSVDFLNSQYCYGIEMKTAFQRKEKDKITVLPIILEECDWKESPIGQLQALPEDGKAIKDHHRHDKGYNKVVEGLRKVINELLTTSNLEYRPEAHLSHDTSIKKLRSTASITLFCPPIIKEVGLFVPLTIVNHANEQDTIVTALLTLDDGTQVEAQRPFMSFVVVGFIGTPIVPPFQLAARDALRGYLYFKVKILQQASGNITLTWASRAITKKRVSISIAPQYISVNEVPTESRDPRVNPTHTETPPNQSEILVTLSKPYPESYSGADTYRISLQYAVLELAKQAGYGYAFAESQQNIGELAKRWVTPNIVAQPFMKALENLLLPFRVRHELRANTIVLHRVMLERSIAKVRHYDFTQTTDLCQEWNVQGTWHVTTDNGLSGKTTDRECLWLKEKLPSKVRVSVIVTIPGNQGRRDFRINMCGRGGSDYYQILLPGSGENYADRFKDWRKDGESIPGRNPDVSFPNNIPITLELEKDGPSFTIWRDNERILHFSDDMYPDGQLGFCTPTGAIIHRVVILELQ